MQKRRVNQITSAFLLPREEVKNGKRSKNIIFIKNQTKNHKI